MSAQDRVHDPPRFGLVGGEIVRTAKGPALRLDRPHLVLQLSSSAAQVLEALARAGSPMSVTELAAETGLAAARVSATLGVFESRGILRRVAPRYPSRFPAVTVVIPAYGRPEATRAAVQSIEELDVPRALLEIVVVDDASPVPLSLEGTAARVLRLESNGGPAAARNAGLASARGELVAFLDNDCTAATSWLAILAAALEEPGVDLAGGRAIAPAVRGVLAAYEAARSPLDMGATRSAVGIGERVPYVPSCNLVVRRTAALALGGFRDGMHVGEDVDFVWRMNAVAGAKARPVVYEPAAMVVHHHRETLGAMLRRRAEYATSEAELARLHPASRRTLVLPVTVSVALLALVGSRYAVLPGAVACALIFAEMVAKRSRIRALALSPARVASAVLRAHGASLYHLSAYASRYHGATLLLAALLFPEVRLIALVLLFTYPIVDANVRRAKVWLPSYVALYTLDMAAYQLGIAWGRVKHRSLSLPRVQLRR